MRKVSILLSLAVIFACKQEPKDYVTLNGKISNPDDSKTLIVYRGKDYKKEINLKDDGTFKDTLKIEDGVYSFKHGDEYGKIGFEDSQIDMKPGYCFELMVSHCDPTVNQFDQFYVIEHERVVDVWPVDLRGKSQ